MKIQSLHLIAFAHFTNKIIDLSRGKEGLHIIYGPNESGKSSSLRALRQVLYGIPIKSTDNFRHAHPDLRIGVSLKHSDGSTLKAVRRKGNSKTLRKMEQESEVVESALLQKFLGNINQTTFESMFGIDHASLVSGGEAILRGSGELGQLLFSTGAGIADLKTVQESLEKEVQDLYARSGSTRRINKQLTEYAEAKKALRDAELPGAEWERHDQALKVAQGRKIQLDAKVAEHRASLSRLKQYRDAIPLIAERTLCLSDLATLENQVLLPDTFADDARRVLEELAVLSHDEQQDSNKLQALSAELSSMTVPQELIERSNQIELMQQTLGSHQKASVDRAGLIHNLEEEHARAKLCLSDLGRETDFESAQALRLSVQEKTKLRKLALDRKALWQARQEAQLQKARHEEKLRQCIESLAKIDKLADCDQLTMTYRRIQHDPQVEDRCAAEQARIERVLRQIGIDLRKLGVPLTVSSHVQLSERLSLLPLPDLHTVETFEREFSQANKELDSWQEKLQTSTEEMKRLETQLNEQETKHFVPTEADLKSIRELRTQGWRLIQRSWKTNEAEPNDIEAFCTAADGKSDLGSAFEWTISHTDLVSDRLRNEADSVARKIQLKQQIAQLSSNIQILNDKISKRQSGLSLLQEEWKKLWLDICEKPITPQQARLWLPAFENVQKTLRTALEDSESLNLLSLQAAKNKTELRAALLATKWTVPNEDASLIAYLERAQECLEHWRSVKQSWSELEKELSKQQAELAAAAENEERRNFDLLAWTANWEPAVASIGLPADTTPEELSAFLDRLEQFFTHYDQMANYNRRIAAIDRDAENFSNDVRELVKQVATDLQGDSPERAAAELYLRLKKAKGLNERRKLLSEQKESIEKSSQARRESLSKLRSRLSLMMAEAKVESENALLDAAKLSEQKRRLIELLENFNRQLVRLAPQSKLERFIEDCAKNDAEFLDNEIPRIEEEMTRLESERDEVQVTIGSELQIVRSMNGAATAADSAIRIQQILAELGQDVEQYARVKIASHILKRAIERYREKHQSPILKRASEIFSRLSSGSFAGLQEDYNDKGEPVLFGCRPNTGALTAIEGMSEGTCDQVYLALRLASLSLYLEREEPLPFIVDDILVNFDDERSLATLRVLAELSERTQVIMFTHHKHIVELAQEHLSPDTVFVHCLSEESPESFIVSELGKIPGLGVR